MVDFDQMSVQQLAELVESYPWFAPARSAMCAKIKAVSGSEAAEGQFKASLAFFPDAGYVAGFIRETANADEFSDVSLAEMIRSAIQEKPRIVVAGMDYFSTEDYNAVREDADGSISRIAVVGEGNDTVVPVDRTEVQPEDIVTETLAQIYVDQGYPEEAETIYNKLILQSPEKSAYFASLIDKLKN